MAKRTTAADSGDHEPETVWAMPSVSTPEDSGSTFVVEPESSDDDDYEESSRLSGVLEDDIEELRRETDRERLAAADRLRDWISEENPSNAPILRRLEGDIRASRKLNEWGAFSLDDLLRPPAYDHSRLLSARLANLLTFVRNLVLFMPVGFTWFAIDRASRAYQESESRSTFLQVWNRNYFSLSTVAFVDAIMIGLLILLTLFAQLSENRAEAVARDRDDDADTRFREVMVDVGLYLHGFRQITPAALGGGLADSVNQLVVATNAMKDASESMGYITAKGSKTLEEFAELSAREFAPAADRLAALASTLEAAAGTHRDLSELVKTLHGHLEGTIGTMDSRMRELINNLMNQMKENVDAIQVSTSDMGTRIDQIGSNLQGAAATTIAAVEALYRRSGGGDGISRS